MASLHSSLHTSAATPTLRAPRARALTRMLVLAVIAAGVAAVASVVTAAVSVVGLVESADARHRQRAEILALVRPTPAIDQAMAQALEPPVEAPPRARPQETDIADDVLDALPATTPILLPGADAYAAMVDPELRAGRIFPVYGDGRVLGFRLYDVRPDALFGRVGLKNGDLVLRVNGERVGDVERAGAVLANLQSARDVRIDVKRQGEPVRIDVAIVPSPPLPPTERDR